MFPKAIEYFQFVLDLAPGSGEIWGLIGHCYLMLDDLEKHTEHTSKPFAIFLIQKTQSCGTESEFSMNVLTLWATQRRVPTSFEMDPNFEKQTKLLSDWVSFTNSKPAIRKLLIALDAF